MLRKMTIYDVDAEDERQKEALRRFYERQYERPGMRPKLLVVLGLIALAVLGGAAIWWSGVPH